MQNLSPRYVAGHVEELDGGDGLHRLVVGESPDDLLFRRDFDDVQGSAEATMMGILFS
jgi:hypothetical protein